MENKTVNIVNKKQVYKYIENRVKPLEIKCGDNERLVYIFDKEECKELYGRWCAYEL